MATQARAGLAQNQSTLSPQPTLKRRHIAAVTIGNALEFYDFLTYAFFSIQIGHAFFPSQSAYGSLMLSLATFGVGYVTRPIGALVIGAYADRQGRRPAMMLCLVLIGASITVMALIPTYSAIGMAAPVLAVIARMVQGFSLGGEVGCNSAYLLEAAATDRRGVTLAWQRCSQTLAQIVGGLVGFGLTMALSAQAPNAYGWRIAFLLGAVAVPFGLWLRTSLPETLTAAEPTTAPPVVAASRMAQVRHSRRIIALGLVVLTGSTMYAGLAEGLPKTIRSAGFGTVFAISIAVFGGTTQLVLTWLIHATGSAMAPAWYLMSATAIAQIGYLLMPESASSRLRATATGGQVAAGLPA